MPLTRSPTVDGRETKEERLLPAKRTPSAFSTTESESHSLTPVTPYVPGPKNKGKKQYVTEDYFISRNINNYFHFQTQEPQIYLTQHGKKVKTPRVSGWRGRERETASISLPATLAAGQFSCHLHENLIATSRPKSHDEAYIASTKIPVRKSPNPQPMPG